MKGSFSFAALIHKVNKFTSLFLQGDTHNKTKALTSAFLWFKSWKVGNGVLRSPTGPTLLWPWILCQLQTALWENSACMLQCWLQWAFSEQDETQTLILTYCSTPGVKVRHIQCVYDHDNNNHILSAIVIIIIYSKRTLIWLSKEMQLRSPVSLSHATVFLCSSSNLCYQDGTMMVLYR